MAYTGNEQNELERVEENSGHAWEEEEQLLLSEDDDDLPWLEADDYEDEEGGFDWRLLGYAVMGLAVVGLLLAAAWYLTREASTPDLVADGSTIEAPDAPYKQRPDDPGGAQVAGTGDQAFEVAEGESTRGRIADGGTEARPAIDREQTPASSPPPASNAVYIQIGAFGSRTDAQAAWGSESRKYSALSGLNHRIVEGDVNGAKVFRLQAAAGDRAQADGICGAIRSAGGDCYIR